MFLTLRSAATRDFRPISKRADFAGLAFVLLLTPLLIEEDCLAEAISCFKLLSVVRVRGIWIRTPLIFLVWIEITCKKRQMDRVKNDSAPPLHGPNWTSRQSRFLAAISSKLVLKNMTVKWSKACLLCQNLEGPEAALRLLWKLAKFWRNLQKFGKFLKLGSHLFYATC